MSSNPLFIIPDFFHFSNELCYGCLSLFCITGTAKRVYLFLYLPKEIFPFPSNILKGSVAEFFWKMQRKACYSILGLDTMPLSLKNLLLSQKW